MPVRYGRGRRTTKPTTGELEGESLRKPKKSIHSSGSLGVEERKETQAISQGLDDLSSGAKRPRAKRSIVRDAEFF